MRLYESYEPPSTLGNSKMLCTTAKENDPAEVPEATPLQRRGPGPKQPADSAGGQLGGGGVQVGQNTTQPPKQYTPSAARRQRHVII